MPTHSCTSEKKLESLYTRKNEVEKLQTDHQKSRLPICQSSVPLLLSSFLPESPYIPLSSIEILIFGVSNRLSFFLSVSTIPYLQITMGKGYLKPPPPKIEGSADYSGAHWLLLCANLAQSANVFSFCIGMQASMAHQEFSCKFHSYHACMPTGAGTALWCGLVHIFDCSGETQLFRFQSKFHQHQGCKKGRNAQDYLAC